ncbi:MAG: SpoIIE family protein phosphatase [Flavobacteriales bacterium]|nr:SpoIIE family protein phosphatase [Flavobacteriales bacterium]
MNLSDSLYFSDPDSSFILCEKAMADPSLRSNEIEMARAHRYKARYYLLKTRYDEANEELTLAEEIYLRKNNVGGQADVLRLRAILYGRLNNPVAETAAIKKAIELYRSIDDHKGMIRVLFNYSLDAAHRRDTSEARWALDELFLLESWMKDSDLYFLFQNQGLYFLACDKAKDALPWFEKAIVVAKDLDMKDSYSTGTMLLGRTYRLLGQSAKAKQYLEESVSFSLANHLDYERSEALEEMVELYKSLNDFKNAFYTLNKLVALNDTLYNFERINRINDLEKKVMLGRKEKELAESKIETAEQKLHAEEARREVGFLWFVISVVLLAAGFSLYLYYRTKGLKDKILYQSKELKLKHEEVSEAYRNITDSIRYAKRIQDAILPSNRIVKEYLKQSFVLYKPKDIVAGDFYWMEQMKNEQGDSLIMYAVCDCTGHGVPGAMVSVLGYNAINRAVREFSLWKPNEVLNKVNELVEDTFSKSDDQVSDGMDVSFCVLDLDNQKLYWSGANNPLLIVREKELLSFAGDKQPIGRFDHKFPFTLHEIELKPKDCIYIFSDGFADQFGGESGKKMKQSRFKELLLDGCSYSMEEQRQRLSIEFDRWRGVLEQIDDVCVIGVRI